jgi:hypothetical protein
VQWVIVQQVSRKWMIHNSFVILLWLIGYPEIVLCDADFGIKA